MGAKKTNTTKKVSKKPNLSKKVAKKLKSKKIADPVEKKITLICLIVSSAVVALSVFVGIFFNPQRVAERKLEELAVDYYENYFYDKFVSTVPKDEKEKVFKDYSEHGFAPVYLRQLLLFDNERDIGYEKYFNTTTYSCDRNATKVQIFPVEPYGKKDYRVEYTSSCNYE